MGEFLGTLTIPVTVCTATIPPRGALLARAIQSVHQQTVQPEAHIIHVDHGRRGGPAILDEAIASAKSEWVAILDDDDEFLPHHLETLWALIEQGADLAFSHFRFGNLQTAGHLEHFRGVPFENEKPRQITKVFLVAKSWWERVGGFSGGFDSLSYELDEQGHRIGEDFVFVKKLAALNARILGTGEVTWIYHTDHENTLGMASRW